MALTVSGNQRYFERDGRPFFWLGDTAWLLFQKLTMDEARLYLENRAAKGYTVIQATLVHKADYANTDGSPALINNDFGTPNADARSNAYWPRVRAIVEYAEELGLIMALLPCWGAFVKNGNLNAGNIEIYTDFLAARFAGYDNVIWLNGGDIRGGDAYEAFDQIGRALRRKCPGQLIGFHPFGRCRSSAWFNDCEWLDFNMFQSGHRNYNQLKLNAWDDKADAETFVGEDNYRYVMADRALTPVKPTLDGEPSYEQIPQGLHDPSLPYWQAQDVRRYAYWSLLAGAAGHTYGHNAIMQFYNGREKGAYGVFQKWHEAIHDEGGAQMKHAKKLMQAMRFYEGAPAQYALVDNTGEKYEYKLALKTPVALCAYSYTGSAINVNTQSLGFANMRGYWFDPVSGCISPFGKVDTAERASFTPPIKLAGQNDWALLIVNAEYADYFITALL